MPKKLVSLEEAKRILQQKFSAEPIGIEYVSLSEAYERVIAKDITAHINVPSFDRATVDGYAVKAKDTFGADETNPITLKNCGSINVGETSAIVVEDGSAAEIATGAPVPQGADAVIMHEHTSRRDPNVILYQPVSKDQNVMKSGSDIKKGDKILKKGQKLSSWEIGVLAALGLAKIEVYKRPKAAIVSTGPEIVEPGKPLPSGKIYDINAHTLSAAVLECCGQPLNLGIVPDETEKLETNIGKALDLADIVITSGGVSAGPKDLVPEVIDSLGEPGVIVSGIAVKPGKPTTIAIVDKKPIFSLPGHPTSSLLMFHILVRPIISKMAGRTEEASPFIVAIAGEKMFSERGRRTFTIVNLSRSKTSQILASMVPTGLSGAITTLTKADGFIEIPESQQFISAGEEVKVYLLKPMLDLLFLKK
jgi:molybdenum cofactor synthesis domain-containing protein